MSKQSARKAAQRSVKTEKCEMCGAVGVKLNRHHTDYLKPTDVQILCAKCHARVHTKPPITAICAVCGKTFVAKDHRSRAKICGTECLAEFGRICAEKRWGNTGKQNLTSHESQQESKTEQTDLNA